MTAARLHVITARDAPAAVILRRGPSKVVAAIGWDRAGHEFRIGQWLKGRIYEHRSDLSPDGRHLVCFAGKGASHWWTAVSRAPFLRAIAFMPQSSTWFGGGAFTPAGEIWLNGGGAWPDDAQDALRPADGRAFPHSTDGFHMGGLYPAMMQARGWRIVAGEGYDTIMTRDLPGGGRLELAFAVGARDRSILSNRYAIVGADGRRCDCPDWEWADLWQDRLQFAARGGLYETPAGHPTGEDATLLRDFSDMSYQEIAAPYEGCAR